MFWMSSQVLKTWQFAVTICVFATHVFIVFWFITHLRAKCKDVQKRSLVKYEIDAWDVNMSKRLNECFPRFSVLFKILLCICNALFLQFSAWTCPTLGQIYSVSYLFIHVALDLTHLYISNNTFCRFHQKIGYSSFVRWNNTSKCQTSPLSEIKTGYRGLKNAY